MDSLLNQARRASRDPRDCRKTIDALKCMGFNEDAFRLLHHQKRGMVEFYAYSEGKQIFREEGSNHRVHQRLMYILLSFLDGSPKGKSFQTLAEEAFKLIPPTR